MDYEYKYLKYKKKYLELCKIKNNKQLGGVWGLTKSKILSLEDVEIVKLKQIIINIFKEDSKLKEFVELISESLIKQLFLDICKNYIDKCVIMKELLKKIASVPNLNGGDIIQTFSNLGTKLSSVNAANIREAARNTSMAIANGMGNAVTAVKTHDYVETGEKFGNKVADVFNAATRGITHGVTATGNALLSTTNSAANASNIVKIKNKISLEKLLDEIIKYIKNILKIK